MLAGVLLDALTELSKCAYLRTTYAESCESVLVQEEVCKDWCCCVTNSFALTGLTNDVGRDRI
jgi:hypothetical protein